MIRNKNLFLIFVYICAVVVAVFLSEIIINILYAKKKAASMDILLARSYCDYPDTHDVMPKEGGYLKADFEDWVIGGYGRRVWWQTNSVGFRNEQEFKTYPKEGVLRILSIGDSFTAGYRIGQNKTFSDLLARWLNREKRYGNAEVLIAASLEPTKGLHYFYRYGQYYHPHIVILGVTLGNDILESYVGLDPGGTYRLTISGNRVSIEKKEGDPTVGFWHGLHRYTIPKQCLETTLADKEIEKKQPAIKQWLLTHSVVAQIIQEKRDLHAPQAIMSAYREYKNPKLFDYLSGLGMYLKSPPEQIDEAYNRFFKILQAFKMLCDQRGITFAVALFPQRFQVQAGDWQKTTAAYGLNKSCFDIMKPNILIRQFCRTHDIVCIDPTEKMTQQYQKNNVSMYFPLGDMHWNKYGHKAYFECAKDEFERLLQQVNFFGK